MELRVEIDAMVRPGRGGGLWWRGRGDAGMEGKVGRGEAGDGGVLDGDGIGAVEGDDHIGAGLGHVAMHRRETGEDRGREIDGVMGRAAGDEAGDGVFVEALVEDEAVVADTAVEAVIASGAAHD